MNKKEIKKIYIEKLKKIQKHNEAYFDKSNPIISDSE